MYAEKTIAALVVLKAVTFGALPKNKYAYDVQYQNGEVEEMVSVDAIRHR